MLPILQTLMDVAFDEQQNDSERLDRIRNILNENFLDNRDKRISFIQDIVDEITDDNDEPKYTYQDLDRMDDFKLLDIRMNWEGLINYSDTVANWMGNCFGFSIDDDYSHLK